MLFLQGSAQGAITLRVQGSASCSETQHKAPGRWTLIPRRLLYLPLSPSKHSRVFWLFYCSNELLIAMQTLCSPRFLQPLFFTLCQLPKLYSWALLSLCQRVRHHAPFGHSVVGPTLLLTRTVYSRAVRFCLKIKFRFSYLKTQFSILICCA